MQEILIINSFIWMCLTFAPMQLQNIQKFQLNNSSEGENVKMLRNGFLDTPALSFGARVKKNISTTHIERSELLQSNFEVTPISKDQNAIRRYTIQNTLRTSIPMDDRKSTRGTQRDIIHVQNNKSPKKMKAIRRRHFTNNTARSLPKLDEIRGDRLSNNGRKHLNLSPEDFRRRPINNQQSLTQQERKGEKIESDKGHGTSVLGYEKNRNTTFMGVAKNYSPSRLLTNYTVVNDLNKSHYNNVNVLHKKKIHNTSPTTDHKSLTLQEQPRRQVDDGRNATVSGNTSSRGKMTMDNIRDKLPSKLPPSTNPRRKPLLVQTGANAMVEEEFSPCPCYWDSKKCGCNCEGSLNYDDFQKLSSSFQPCLNFSFTINGGSYFSLPPNLFIRIGSVHNIHLNISNATFDYLFDPTPSTSPFKEVSFQKSALIEVQNVRVKRGWNWSSLQDLRSSSGAGVDLQLRGCGLRRLSSDFNKVASGNVGTVTVSESGLEMVGSGAFATFDGLVRFRLPKNRLKSIRRTDLPPVPQDLTEIDLRDNHLQSLEADLFTRMPSLQVISLAGNPLQIFSEETFLPVIGSAHLQGMDEFSLYCDCRLRWLKNSTLSHNSVVLENLKGATCRRPPHLRGTPFKDLSKEHLIC